jgi:hypothetical protein
MLKSLTLKWTLWGICVRNRLGKLSRKQRLRVLLLTLNLVLLGGVLIEWAMVHLTTSFAASRFLSTTKALPAALVPEVKFSLKDELSYNDFVDRPLFAVDRKPRAASAKQEGPAPDKTVSLEFPSSLKLAGVLLSSRQKVAVVKGGDGKPKRLRVKDVVDGWELVDIRHDYVTLSNGISVQELRIQPRTPGLAPMVPDARQPPVSAGDGGVAPVSVGQNASSPERQELDASTEGNGEETKEKPAPYPSSPKGLPTSAEE